VQSSIQRQLSLATEGKRVPAAEQSIAEMMVDLCRSHAEPLTEETLFRWHRMVIPGRRDLAAEGKFRTGAEPMQIVSGAVGAERVYFEAPPAKRVPGEMKRFLA